MKPLLTAIRFFIFFTILTGIFYPLAMTLIGHVFFARQTSGDILQRSNVSLGSSLIAQKFESEKYFWPRPSSQNFNPMPSGGSNLGQGSADLKTAYDERFARLKAAHPGVGEPPQDLLFASASGLDPHISPEAASFQLNRVAKSRKLDVTAVSKLIAEMTEPRQFGFLGDPRVNVLALNLALDRSQGVTSVPVLLPVSTPASPPTGR
jgi:K+-transporting ATPase ATPase C chain